ncbi:MAG: serine/threonine-protein kinase [Gemmataceae bacterium]
MSADRNLLFGTLAVRLGFVTQNQCDAGLSACHLDGVRSLGQALHDLGHLTSEQLHQLNAQVEDRLPHNGDVTLGLATHSEAAASVTMPPTDVPDGDSQRTILQGDLSHSAGRQSTATGVRYRILKPHARGGLGEVFVAEDMELRRSVALKEIQGRFADDADSRDRFVREAEVTGGLEHPGIVPVYGLGVHPDGRPYYAMRFIQGDTLHDAIRRFQVPAIGACERPDSATNRGVHTPRSPDFTSLSFRELLRRFVDVCNTVAYAHSRGVLHRDLKPSNIMLGPYGETLVVDWGLAKRLTGEPEIVGLRSEVSDASHGGLPHSSSPGSNTAIGRTLGTPAYMSPEQADGRLDQLGPATDVYSLGATLYELLCRRVSVEASNLDDLLVRICTGQFDRPRTVLPTVPPALEAICLKAMALAPADRYSGVLALADDVERWLADEPVTAYREPIGVRLRRWGRRHARLATALAAAVLIGAGVLALLAWQSERARRAVAAEAEQKEIARAAAVEAADAERAAREQAQRRLAQVVKFNEILGSIFQDLNPRIAEKEGKPLQAILGERLDRAAAAIDGEAIGDELAVAHMQLTLGESHLGLGYPERAVELAERARATLTARLGPDDPETLRAANNLAESYRAAGRIDLALPLYEDTLRRRTARLGADHAETAISLGNLALGLRAAGKLDLARPIFEEVFRQRKSALGPDHPSTLISMNNLALAYRDSGKLDLARPLYEEALRLRMAKFGPEHAETLVSKNNLAEYYQAAGRLDLALPLFEEVVAHMKAKLGPDHPSTLIAMSNLALAYRAAGKLEAALPLFEESLRLLTIKLGPDHPSTLIAMSNLALGYRDANKPDAALSLFEDVLRRRRAKLGADHPDTLVSLGNLALSYRAARRFDEALLLFEESLRLRRAKLGADHADTVLSLNNLATCYDSAGQLDRAEPLLRELADIAKRKAGSESSQFTGALAAVGLNLLTQQKWSAAEPILRECLAIREKVQPDAWMTFNTKSQLGGSLLGQRRYAEAEPLLVDGFHGLKRRSDRISKAGKIRLPEAAERLMQLYNAIGKPDEAATWRKELESLKATP